MRFTKKPQAEPIPGYRLLEPMGSGGFGEVWKCEAPGGLLKAIKFVYGNLNGVGEGRVPAKEELDAIQRVKAIRHPFLLSMERVECLDGELIIVMELADKNLWDRLQECKNSGQTGIPREELIAYMTEAAEALDLMNLQHNLQHLDIKPHNLFLVSNHVKVGDFGLVHGVTGRTTQQAESLTVSSVTPLYASPETFRGEFTPRSDQYSLAIVYQELLTGSLPFNGKNVRQLLLQHSTSEPDLKAVSEWDRPAVAKALAKDSRARFPSCSHFVRALVAGWIPNQLALVAGLGSRENTAKLNSGSSASVSSLVLALQAAPTEASLLLPTEPPNRDSAPAVTAAPVETETVLTCATVPRSHPVAIRSTALPQSLQGYELSKRLRSNPLSEVWEARSRDGRPCLVHQIFGWALRSAEKLQEAVGRWTAIRHPGCLHTTLLQAVPGRLVFATAPIARTLRNRLQECRQQGLPGIPRVELLGYLTHAAATLDDLHESTGLAHLGLSPLHLLPEDGVARLCDFGLAQLFWLPGGSAAHGLASRYAAPELAQGKLSSACDQFSLALIYLEMLTGILPRRAGGTRGKPSATAAPDLSTLDEATERAALARALDADPRKRWPCCADMIQALGGEVSRNFPKRTDTDTAAEDSALPADLESSQTLEGTFTANLPPEITRQRFEGFRVQWNAEVDGIDEDRFVYTVTMLGNLWQTCLGQQPGLEVETRLHRSLSVPMAPIEVSVRIRPVGCGAEQGAKFLQEMGNLLFESLQAHLHAVPQRRTEERLPWHYSLEMRPVLEGGELGEIIECQGKDISLNGIGFYSPQELNVAQVSLVLPETPQTPRAVTLANIVRVKRCGAGWHEFGAILLAPSPREEVAEESEQLVATG